ncbi:MAG TPA: hypothetical protein DCZ76_07915 [Treponema sp.]|nr:hypothetical protein [Treponema sp.]
MANAGAAGIGAPPQAFSQSENGAIAEVRKAPKKMVKSSFGTQKFCRKKRRKKRIMQKIRT